MQLQDIVRRYVLLMILRIYSNVYTFTIYYHFVRGYHRCGSCLQYNYWMQQRTQPTSFISFHNVLIDSETLLTLLHHMKSIPTFTFPPLHTKVMSWLELCKTSVDFRNFWGNSLCRFLYSSNFVNHVILRTQRLFFLSKYHAVQFTSM